MLAFLIYGSSIVHVEAQYPGYDKKYRPLIGGIQIEITKAEWYGPSYKKSSCSLAFPVSFTENNVGRLGFITARQNIYFGGNANISNIRKQYNLCTSPISWVW
jgi:hypothetical protein